MRKILIGLYLVFVSSAVTIAHGESVDMKMFGRCAVMTVVDEFTDEKSPQLICFGKGTNLGKYQVTLTCMKETFGTLLRAGIRFRLDETIDVRYRFDKGTLVTESWRYGENVAVNFDKAVHHRFVEGIEKAKKLIFKVGDEAGAVDLTGSEGAMTEYKKRCAALGRPIK